jgi:hypothetical protein
LAKIKATGFGFIPKETKHHFLLNIPSGKYNQITVYERFKWDDDQVKQKSELVEKNIKVIISKQKWEAVKSVVEKEFNQRLKINNINVGKFKTGENIIERLLGKELVLLLWAIEDSDPALINTALKNWLGLSPEERWWLFTMANASTGYHNNKRGWRIAIRYALTDNPVNEKIKQMTIFDRLKD